MRSVAVIIALFSLFYIVNCRPSWYYSSQDNSGYHPPYDFSASSNTLAALGLSSPTSCSPLCPSGTNTVAIRNTNYTLTGTGSCSNLPYWMQSSNLPIPSINFDSCCGVYEQCAQSCDTTKEYCDQQFYGCMWGQCAYSFRVRPGDRITCRAYATCYASYLTNNMTCERFSAMQQQACSCISNGQTVPFATPSPAPAQQVNDTMVGKRQAASASSLPNQASPSPLPTSNPTVGSSSSSSGTYSADSSSNNNNVNYLPGTTQYYRARPVMLWSDMYGQCPPNIGSYVNVFSDQEMDDINYYLTNSAGSLSMWLKYLF